MRHLRCARRTISSSRRWLTHRSRRPRTDGPGHGRSRSGGPRSGARVSREATDTGPDPLTRRTLRRPGTDHRAAAVSGGRILAPEQAQAVTEEARAWRSANAFRPVRYLCDRPDALSMPSSDCPTGVVRLLAALTAPGHGDKVALVRCGDCGRTDPLPTNNGPEGRLCSRCAGRRAKKPCARCGKVAGIYARRPEGGICNPCRNKEPDAKQECADCRRMMISYRRLPDGTSLCQTCAPKNTQTCCRCGRLRRVNALTSDGPVCGGCYSSPARLCGICGQIVPIVARADGTRPDTCGVRRSGGCGVAEKNGGRLSSQGSVCGDRRCHLTALGLQAEDREVFRRETRWPWTVDHARALRVLRRRAPGRRTRRAIRRRRCPAPSRTRRPSIQWTPRRRSSGWTRCAPAQSPPRSPSSRPPARRSASGSRAGPAGPRGRSVFRRP